MLRAHLGQLPSGVRLERDQLRLGGRLPRRRVRPPRLDVVRRALLQRCLGETRLALRLQRGVRRAQLLRVVRRVRPSHRQLRIRLRQRGLQAGDETLVLTVGDRGLLRRAAHLCRELRLDVGHLPLRVQRERVAKVVQLLLSSLKVGVARLQARLPRLCRTQGVDQFDLAYAPRRIIALQLFDRHLEVAHCRAVHGRMAVGRGARLAEHAPLQRGGRRRRSGRRCAPAGARRAHRRGRARRHDGGGLPLRNRRERRLASPRPHPDKRWRAARDVETVARRGHLPGGRVDDDGAAVADAVCSPSRGRAEAAAAARRACDAIGSDLASEAHEEQLNAVGIQRGEHRIAQVRHRALVALQPPKELAKDAARLAGGDAVGDGRAEQLELRLDRQLEEQRPEHLAQARSRKRGGEVA